MDDNAINVASSKQGEEVTEAPLKRFTKWRNIIGFWILGLANNYPYVIMLSAAFDTIHELEDKHVHKNATVDPLDSCTLINGSYKEREHCERAGTSLVLLADVLPQFIIKLVAPYFMNFIPYWLRILMVVGFSLSCFTFVGLGLNIGLVIFGILCASISAGFGELTFLSLTARYDKSTVSAWSSGTGAAGVAGALVYAGLTFLISPKATLLIQLFMPLVMLVTFLFVLGKPKKILPTENGASKRHIQDSKVPSHPATFIQKEQPDGDSQPLLGERKMAKIKLINKEEAAFWWSHVKYIPRLWKYMLPLFLVYVAEYMINQGFFELLYNENTHIGSLCISQEAQYRLLQVMYQVGVFLSRSSLALFQFKWFWILSVLQMINFAFFFCAAIYLFLPSFWLTIFIVLYEGLLGGGVYVNAFYALSKQVPKVHREFSMGVASAADTSGITVAAVLSQLVHSFVCSRYIGYKP